LKKGPHRADPFCFIGGGRGGHGNVHILVRPSRFSTLLRGLFRSSSRNRALRPSQNYWTQCVGGSMRCPRRGRQRHCGSVL